MFKIAGVVLGFMLYRFFGAFVGYFLGSFIDRTLAYGVGGVNPLSRAHRQSVFLETERPADGQNRKSRWPCVRSRNCPC